MKNNATVYEWGDLLIPTEEGYNTGLFRQNDYVIFLREREGGFLSCIRFGKSTVEAYSPNFLQYGGKLKISRPKENKKAS